MFPHRLASCILSGIVLLLLVVVHACPGWAVYTKTVQPLHAGLWVICSPDKCSFLNVREVKLDMTRGFMVMAVFTSFVAILWSAEWHYLNKCTAAIFSQGTIVAAVCNMFTGIFILTALVIFEVSIWWSKPPGKVKTPSKQWAYYTSCAICILSFLTGIYDVILYKFSLWGTPAPAAEVGPEE